jgi:hypothetical protein
MQSRPALTWGWTWTYPGPTWWWTRSRPNKTVQSTMKALTVYSTRTTVRHNSIHNECTNSAQYPAQH